MSSMHGPIIFYLIIFFLENKQTWKSYVEPRSNMHTSIRELMRCHLYVINFAHFTSLRRDEAKEHFKIKQDWLVGMHERLTNKYKESQFH